jgi:hypothetical protein
MEAIRLSKLGHTWILDLDGTVVRHNGYLTEGHDTVLDGALEFLSGIPEGDMVVFITSRTDDYKDATERFLAENGIRYDYILFGAPVGERILINDRKPSRLATAFAVNTDRDVFCTTKFGIDEEL